MTQLTPAQFDALATLMQLKPDSVAARVARLVAVDGLSIGDAARECGASYNAAHQAVKRVERAHALALEATTSH